MKTMNEFINELKQNGFKVYTSDTKEEVSYINFVKDNKIGYCQISQWGQYSFSTVHKPCREAGTGFNVYDETEEPTVYKAMECFVIAPKWAVNRKRYGVNSHESPIEKYNSWEDYLSYPINQILTQKEL